MKDVLILAGGKGLRINEMTYITPKPLIKIKKKNLLFRIMKHYSSFQKFRFVILGGYKFDVLKKELKRKLYDNFNILLLNTGLNTETGSRIGMAKKFMDLKKNDFFLATYGDGLSDININKSIKFHLKKKKIATVSAVRPPARFGRIIFNNSKLVTSFEEKNKNNEGWINGGFFVFNNKIFSYINNNKNTALEKNVFEKLVKIQEVCAFRHKGFWQCCDNKKDYDYLSKIIN
jgi:glucose-1-phosphate cytidylyltransferase